MNKNLKKLITYLILLSFLLVSCKKDYPILYYDTDLSKDLRNSINTSYEKQLEVQESLRKLNEESQDDETTSNVKKNVVVDSSIDDDFVTYEENEDKLLDDGLSSYDTSNTSTNNFPVVTLFKNKPDFDLSIYKAETFENYSDLDSLGRVGKAEAMIGKETMPTTGRESIGMIKPTGWHTVKYDNIDGNYLYNRCHLIGWQLSAENANEKNLFTGTRYLNVEGMLPFENQVASYIKSTGNHVLYRVTPYYSGNNLLVSHVQIEAMSFEDKGAGVSFNVKLDNIQPGIHINYADGSSYQEVSTNS